MTDNYVYRQCALTPAELARVDALVAQATPPTSRAQVLRALVMAGLEAKHGR